MRLILVRHGESTWNRDGKFLGKSPVDLTETGLAQARHVARATASLNPSVLYSSVLLRTMTTAEQISRQVSLPVLPLDGIEEIDLGDLEGLNSGALRGEYAYISEQWRKDPSKACFPNGESMIQLQQRVQAALDSIQQCHPQDTVVAVSHNFPIRIMLLRHLGLPLSRFHRTRVDLGSITILESKPGLKQVVRVNDTCHLPEDLLRPG